MISSKKDIIKVISLETGMSVSSIYKILSNPFHFSPQSVNAVRKAAEKHGLAMSHENGGMSAGREESISFRRILRIAIVTPSRPLLFWKEAILGFEKAREQLEDAYDLTIEFVYAYHYFPINESENTRLFTNLETQALDGCILYPICGEICHSFIERVGSRVSLVIFNDLQDYMTDAWFAEHSNICFIGTDSYDEGYKAASVVLARGRQVRRLAAVHVTNDAGCQSSRIRVQGFCDGMRAYAPHAEVICVEETSLKRNTASILARKLEPLYDQEEQGLDCVYFGNGCTHIACSAIEKLARIQENAVHTVVVGHELMDGDKRYLMEGRLCGYIKQDIYTQGFAAMHDMVSCILSGVPLKKRMYQSSMFIR